MPKPLSPIPVGAQDEQKLPSAVALRQATGGFVADHKDTGETHVFSDMASLQDHLAGHFGDKAPKPKSEDFKPPEVKGDLLNQGSEAGPKLPAPAKPKLPKGDSSYHA